MVVAIQARIRSYPTLDGNVAAIASKAATVMEMRIVPANMDAVPRLG